MRDLLVLIPTRGRPDNIRKVISAWDFTNAWDVAELWLIVDQDDPEIQGYRDLEDAAARPMWLAEMPTWRPMVHKLNEAAAKVVNERRYFALAFAGDDHLPQTIGWAQRYLAALHELQTGMVYGDDGYQGANLSTEWAVTADVVRALGRMVPADVEHLYCDNAMMDLFRGAGALRHLPEVRIEHFNPYAHGKAAMDDQYKRVNGSAQFKKDRAGYENWQRSGMLTDIEQVRALRVGLPDVRPSASAERPHKAGAMPRAVPPRPRGNKPVTRFGIPRHFKKVRGATPDEIGVTLADFASQVPSDQAIVELGVFQGRTALLMAWGARQGQGAHVWGIDAWNLEGNTYGPPFNEIGSKTWAEYNVMALGFNSAITLIQNFASDAAAVWAGPPIGLLFIDDDHSYAGARRAVEDWAPHLAPGAVIAIDDHGHPDWPGVEMAVTDLVNEGVLAPIEIFHDRLAVTKLLFDAPNRRNGGQPLAADSEVSTITAITSEGVHPVAALPLAAPVFTEPGCLHSECILEHPHAGPPELAPEPVATQPLPVERESATGDPVRHLVHAGELDGVAEGTAIVELNLVNLKALAKRRGIVLGVRKDKRDAILQALAEGR
jgi:hypothetical protein